MQIDCDRMTVEIDGKATRLSRTLFHIVAYLAAHPGMIRSRAQILQAAFEGGECGKSERAVDTAIKKIRRSGLRQIRTYYSGGYFWDDGIETASING